VGTERLQEALTAVERVAGLSKTLLGRIKGAFARACVAYAEGHIEIASHELMTLDLWHTRSTNWATPSTWLGPRCGKPTPLRFD
jgi:hypothetical protein